MKFMSSRSDVVRSKNQRWLLSYWHRLLDSRAVPIWPGFEAEELADMAEHLSLQDVVESEGNARLLVRFHGRRISEAFGLVGEGKFLDELLPLPYRQAALSTYHRVLVTKLPVYTTADMRDRDGRVVHYDRLLVPFSHDGVTVNRILASLEIVSPEGAFDNRDIMKSAPKPPAFALCATIQH